MTPARREAFRAEAAARAHAIVNGLPLEAAPLTDPDQLNRAYAEYDAQVKHDNAAREMAIDAWSGVGDVRYLLPPEHPSMSVLKIALSVGTLLAACLIGVLIGLNLPLHW